MTLTDEAKVLLHHDDRTDDPSSTAEGPIMTHKYKARVQMTLTDEHAANFEVEADTLAEAINQFESYIADDYQEDERDYHSADDTRWHFVKCEIDGVPVADEFGTGSQDQS